MGREKYKYFCSEQMVQWLQEMFIIKRIEWFCFKWNMWVDLLRYQRYNYGRVWFEDILLFVFIGKHVCFANLIFSWQTLSGGLNWACLSRQLWNASDLLCWTFSVLGKAQLCRVALKKICQGSGINGTQHKSTKATRHEMPTVMANNKSGASMV